MTSNENSPKLSERTRVILVRWARLLALGSCIGVLTPWIGSVHFLLELGSHFIPIYAFASWISLSFLIALGDKRTAVAAAGSLAACGILLAPYYWPREKTLDRGTLLRVMTANVLTSNRDYARFLDCVERENPAVIALTEIDQAWVDALLPLRDEYPHRYFVPREDNFGVGILSRVPLKDTETESLAGVPSIKTRLVLPERSIGIQVVHTFPPSNSEAAATRNRQFQMIADSLKDTDGAFILAGDFNTTMWSPHFRNFLAVSGLRNPRHGLGLLGTWPTDLDPLLLPIDHCLYTYPLTTWRVHTGQAFGSDHLPLIVDFSLPGRQTARDHLWIQGKPSKSSR